MQEVIVSADGSRRSLDALNVGEVLAAQLGLPITLFSVVHDPDSSSQRRELLERALRERTPQAPVPSLELAPSVSVTGALVKLLQERPDSLLCMATQGYGAVAQAALGTVSQAVVEQARRPVVLAGPRLQPDWQAPVRTLMVCLDGSPVSEAVLPLAVQLGKALNARLRLLHALDPQLLLTPGADDIAESGYLQQQAHRLRETSGVEADWEVLHGKRPGQAVADHCRGEAGAMVVMTTHGRSGLARIALGSVAHQVVREADCPVVVLRPRRGR